MPYTTINKGSSYFNTVLYTGNGATQSVTGVGFQPDWVWIKNRSNAVSSCITDAVRGTNLQLASNSTGADQSTTDGITSFNSNGFSLGAGTQQYSSNTNAQTYASWNWLANNTSGSSNTSGSITSTVAANTTAGFSIVTYTYTSGSVTVGHGLGVAPSMIIVKTRSVSDNWRVYHKSLGNSAFVPFTTAAQTTGSTAWNSTSPTSSVFSLGSFWGGTDTQIAYCFAEIRGYSKFDSYTGNGSTNGTFIYTGFKPAWVMVKRTDSTGSWRIFDDVRSPFNVIDKFLYANLSNAEDVDPVVDFLSNGFKFRNTSTDNNASGGTYLYMAFAENPFVTSGGIPVTAR